MGAGIDGIDVSEEGAGELWGEHGGRHKEAMHREKGTR